MAVLVSVRKVKKGEYVRLGSPDSGPVWIRGEYDKADKRFYFDAFDDVCRMTKRKGDDKVWIGFTF